MIRETVAESALELAARRLDRALLALDQRLARAAAASRDPGGDLFAAGQNPKADADLQAELERVRTRERDLETAGAEASAALGRAIHEIRAALNGAASPTEP
jgi:hypothetical protein